MNHSENPWLGDRKAVVMLLILTFVAGGVDATTFLFMGGTFVSNQTGTVLLLAMNGAGVQAVDTGAALVSILGFVVGASIAGRVLRKVTPLESWPRRTSALLWIEAALLFTSGALLHLTSLPAAWTVAPLGFAMGTQAAIAFRMAKPFLTTGYVTGAITGAATSSPIGDRSRRWWWYAILPVGSIGLGALSMTVIAEHTVVGAIAFITTLTAVTAVMAGMDEALRP